MVTRVVIDPDSRSLQESFALVQSRRRSRERFAEGIVTLVESETAARAGADPNRHIHAAVVYGPSVSSEGQRLYYLVRWL